MSKQPSFNPNYPQLPPQGGPPPQAGYAPPPQGYAPPPQGYAPPPQGYAPPPQGYAPPPQGYAPPPQGYAPPPQGHAPPPMKTYPRQPAPQGQAPPPQGYAPYGQPPPQGYAPVTQVHQTNVVYQQQSTASSTFGGLLKSAGRLASGAVNTIQKEVDLHVSSPLLDLFATNNILQFLSCASNRYFRSLPNGSVDSAGVPTGADSQFMVVNTGNNIVTLRNLATQNKFLTIKNGILSCSGVGDFHCKFRLHETSKGFITFESLAEPGTHIGVLPTGQIKSCKLCRSKDESTRFSVTLLYTRTMVGQPVQQGHTVYQTTVVHRK